MGLLSLSISHSHCRSLYSLRPRLSSLSPSPSPSLKFLSLRPRLSSSRTDLNRSSTTTASVIII
ncbi:hypothetical protein LOK49_Contig203G00005 [Camellia lanceoleosa]|nr:hypothetical protein LOK49_Contig203G00005 [Camellia lanceoleosa]